MLLFGSWKVWANWTQNVVTENGQEWIRPQISDFHETVFSQIDQVASNWLQKSSVFLYDHFWTSPTICQPTALHIF
jgi:hypothetical protein